MSAETTILFRDICRNVPKLKCYEFGTDVLSDHHTLCVHINITKEKFSDQ